MNGGMIKIKKIGKLSELFNKRFQLPEGKICTLHNKNGEQIPEHDFEIPAQYYTNQVCTCLERTAYDTLKNENLIEDWVGRICIFNGNRPFDIIVLPRAYYASLVMDMLLQIFKDYPLEFLEYVLYKFDELRRLYQARKEREEIVNE